MIIAIEGHSYTGKTTIIDTLSKNTTVTTLPETDIYAGGIENYPPFPPLTTEMAENNVEFFINLERNRKKDCDNSTGIVIIDRSFLSVILFQKFIRQLPNDWMNAFEYAKRRYLELINQDRVILPDAIVIVRCASTEEYVSRVSRDISVAELRSTEAYDYFTNEYTRLLKAYKQIGRLVEIISSNGNNLAEVGKRIIAETPGKPLSVIDKKMLLKTIVENI